MIELNIWKVYYAIILQSFTRYQTTKFKTSYYGNYGES